MFVTLLGALSEHFSPCLGVSTPLPSVLLPVAHKDSVLCDSYLTTAEYFVLCDVVGKKQELSSLKILVGILFTSQRGVLHKPLPMCQIRDTFKNLYLGNFRCSSAELS